jgi:site-specific DNA-methyltransferase (adenine-specific)
MTPEWAADELVARYFADLSPADTVLEPSCGTGAFLSAIPADVPAYGVEIDPELAAIARANTGRHVVVGDFRMVDLPVRPTAILGNPPFTVRTVDEFLTRALTVLPDAGRVGFLLPAFQFQTASSIDRLARDWSIRSEFIPRNLFPGLRAPLCFAVFTKERERSLVGFALYHETAAVNRLRKRYRALLAQGERSVWSAVTRAALEALGGRATLPALYAEIDGARPTPNAFWQEKVRQTLQRIAVRVGAGEWALPTAGAIAA